MSPPGMVLYFNDDDVPETVFEIIHNNVLFTIRRTASKSLSDDVATLFAIVLQRRYNAFCGFVATNMRIVCSVISMLSPPGDRSAVSCLVIGQC